MCIYAKQVLRASNALKFAVKSNLPFYSLTPAGAYLDFFSLEGEGGGYLGSKQNLFSKQQNSDHFLRGHRITKAYTNVELIISLDWYLLRYVTIDTCCFIGARKSWFASLMLGNSEKTKQNLWSKEFKKRRQLQKKAWKRLNVENLLKESWEKLRDANKFYKMLYITLET